MLVKYILHSAKEALDFVSGFGLKLSDSLIVSSILRSSALNFDVFNLHAPVDHLFHMPELLEDLYPLNGIF